MFKKLFIANRGEIAARIARTARRMGIVTVIPRSELERSKSLDILADERPLLAGETLTECYLNHRNVLECAQSSVADALHPGYGFLAESAEFAELISSAGIVFVGPQPHTIREVGEKHKAKQIAATLGIPVIPGYNGEDQTSEALAKAALQIGFPLLIKAVAGGGGRGMRLVREPKDLAAEITAAQSEAQLAFGSSQILLERFIENPRHIEVQLIGDSSGQIFHLFERECSLQRRHQKIIEEAPSITIPLLTISAIRQAAEKIGTHVNLSNAATVEFLVDAKGAYYFLEINPRIQVEHPVTEEIAGVDIVELQLRAAAGERLSIKPLTTANQFSIEARICAESPRDNFIPTEGRVRKIFLPSTPNPSTRLRLEHALSEGEAVSSAFDSLLAKLICTAPTRKQALAGLTKALAEFVIAGVETNREFLLSLLSDSEIQDGAISTQLIDNCPTKFVSPRSNAELLAKIAAIGAYLGHLSNGGTESLKNSPFITTPFFGSNFSDVSHHQRTFQISAAEQRFSTELSVKLLAFKGGKLEVSFNDHKESWGWHSHFNQPLPDGVEISQIESVRTPTNSLIVVNGAVFSVEEKRANSDSKASSELSSELYSHLPGRVLKILIEAGQEVERGAPLVILESMKMEHTITSPLTGLINEILASEGERVSQGTVLLKLKAT